MSVQKPLRANDSKQFVVNAGILAMIREMQLGAAQTSAVDAGPARRSQSGTANTLVKPTATPSVLPVVLR